MMIGKSLSVLWIISLNHIFQQAKMEIAADFLFPEIFTAQRDSSLRELYYAVHLCLHS